MQPATPVVRANGLTRVIPQTIFVLCNINLHPERNNVKLYLYLCKRNGITCLQSILSLSLSCLPWWFNHRYCIADCFTSLIPNCHLTDLHVGLDDLNN